MEIPELRTVPEAAHILGVSPSTIRNRISLGTFELPTVLFCGRRLIRRSDIDAFLRGEPLSTSLPIATTNLARKRGRPRKQMPKSQGDGK